MMKQTWPPRAPELRPDVQALINNGLEFLDKTTHPVFAAGFPDFIQVAMNPPVTGFRISLLASSKSRACCSLLSGLIARSHL